MPLKKAIKKASSKKGVKSRAALKKLVQKKPVKKNPVKKSSTKKAPKKSQVSFKAGVDVIGIVTHYFPKVRAAVIKLKAPLAVGDKIKFKGHTSDFMQSVKSIQMEHVSINPAKRGQEIGLLVDSRVRVGDIVYKT